MNNDKPIVLGAVAYLPKVVDIWEGFKQFFIENKLHFDFVLYSNYERQVEALFRGEVDVAWNSPLAWVRSKRIAESLNKKVVSLAMRDTDCDLTSLVISLKSNNVKSLQDLKGKRVGVGAIDSPQATLIPLEILKKEGLEKDKEINVIYHNVLSGKHGDHVGGEEDCVRSLVDGRVDAACLIKANLQGFIDSSIVNEEDVFILKETPSYDHCNFTALEAHRKEELKYFTEILLKMDYDDINVRKLLEMEGLRKWKIGRESQYNILESAVDSLSFYDKDGSITEKNYFY